jgi:signal recognition particle GTPase
VQEVNLLLKQFKQTQQLMKQMKNMGLGGTGGGLFGGAGAFPGMPMN